MPFRRVNGIALTRCVHVEQKQRRDCLVGCKITHHFLRVFRFLISPNTPSQCDLKRILMILRPQAVTITEVILFLSFYVFF